MGSKTCMAEDQCISKFCGKGYDHTSQKFPYSVNYTKWAWEGEDVFDFRVRLEWHILHAASRLGASSCLSLLQLPAIGCQQCGCACTMLA